MSKAACAKEILCAVSEATAAASKYGEYVTDEELRRAQIICEEAQSLRVELANRADEDGD